MSDLDLEQMFATRSQEPINYESRSYDFGFDIRPHPDDGMKDVVRKANAWRRIVEDGYSLAVALGMMNQGDVPFDYEAEARKHFTDMERRQYEAWKAHKKMPALDKEKDRAKWDAKKGSQQTQADRVVALRVLYNNPQLTKENLAWFVTNKTVLIPLLCAVVKIAAARKAATAGTDADPRDFQETLAIRTCKAHAARIVGRVMEELAQMNRQIDSMKSVLDAREKQTRIQGEAAHRKKDVENSIRRDLGVPEVGKPQIWNAPGAVGRRERVMGAARKEAGKRSATAAGLGTSGGGGVRARRADSPQYRPASPGELRQSMGELRLEGVLPRAPAGDTLESIFKGAMGEDPLASDGEDTYMDVFSGPSRPTGVKRPTEETGGGAASKKPAGPRPPVE